MKKLKSLLSRNPSAEEPLHLQDSDGFLKDVVENIEEGFALYDVDDRLVLCNDTFLHMFPAIRKIVENSPTYLEIEKLLLKEKQIKISHAAHNHWIQTRLKQRSKRHCQFEYQLTDGRWIKIKDRRTSRGNTISICYDITDTKVREEKLRAAKEIAETASRTKSTFLAHASHELKTPLNAITGFSEIMARQLFGPIGNEQYQSYVEDIYQGSQHLLGLIDDILNISKAEVGHLELNEDTFSLAEVTMQIDRMISQRIQEAGLSLEVRLTPHLPLLYADERKIKQILINLLMNSIKFTPKGGKIILSILQKGHEDIQLIIEDTGIGMKKEDIPKALEAFGQLGGIDSAASEGSGLGLYLTSTYVRLHGGKLKIHSKQNHGTTVTIALPQTRIVKAAA